MGQEVRNIENGSACEIHVGAQGNSQGVVEC